MNQFCGKKIIINEFMDPGPQDVKLLLQKDLKNPEMSIRLKDKQRKE